MGARLGIYAEVASGTKNGAYLSYFSHFFSKMEEDSNQKWHNLGKYV